MKRAFLFIFLFSVILTSLDAQDLIVTTGNDSIHCKITKANNDYIYFTFKSESEFQSSLLAFKDVKSYHKGFFASPEVGDHQVVGFESFPKFRIAINAGYSRLLAKTADGYPSVFDSYLKDLKSGFHFGADVSYYFNPTIGIGLKGVVFKTSNSMDDVYVEDDEGNQYYGIMSDQINTTFIGPTFSTRFLSKKNTNAFIMSAGLGYLGYKNDAVFISNMTMKGATVGLSLDFAYDIAIGEHSAIGLQISLISGALTKFELSDGQQSEIIQLEEGSYESLNRLDISFGFRFGK